MGASQVSGMKMRNLLFGLILGLLAVVHSTPVDTVTQIPAKAEDDVLREAVTDGFLVEPHFTPSRTTESPKRNTTVQASQQPSTDSKQENMLEVVTDGFLVEHLFTPSHTTESPKRSSTVRDMIEGSGAGGESMTSVFPKFASTTLRVSHTQSSTSTVLPKDTDSSSSHSVPTTQSPQSTSMSSLVPNEAQPSITPDHILHSQSTDPSVSSFGFLSTHSSDSGSGDGEIFGHHFSTTSSMTTSSSTETSTASSTFTSASVRTKGPVTFPVNEGSGAGEESGSGMDSSTVSTTTAMPILNDNSPRLFSPIERSGSGSEGKNLRMVEPPVGDKVQRPQQPSPTEPTNKGHSTPGWIIILGFVVGVAALVMLCVAIATRDKWNGPSKASQLVTTTNSSNQQRELEMETFLHKDQPRENGKAAEYTVIPLDELPEKCSSD